MVDYWLLPCPVVFEYYIDGIAIEDCDRWRHNEQKSTISLHPRILPPTISIIPLASSIQPREHPQLHRTSKFRFNSRCKRSIIIEIFMKIQINLIIEYILFYSSMYI